MFLGPVFTAEVITSGRRRRYFLMRIAYALTLTLPLALQPVQIGFMNVRPTIQDVAQSMAIFFASFGVIQIIAVMVMTPALMAGIIASERDRRTIDYLMVAPLSSFEIIGGKLAAAMVRAITVLLVGLPVVAIAGLRGGISPIRLLMLFAISLSTLVAVGGLSILISTLCETTRRALRSLFALLAAYIIIPWAVRIMLVAWTRGGAAPGWMTKVMEWIEWSQRINPFIAWGMVSLPQSGGSFEPLWTAVMAHLVIGLGCVALAVLLLRWTQRRTASIVRADPGKQSFTSRRRAVGRYPMVWKEILPRLPRRRLRWLPRAGGPIGALVAMVMFVSWQWITAFDRPGSISAFIDNTRFTTTLLFAIVGSLLFLAIGAIAAGTITSERQKQTWDVLLSTPLSPSAIVLGKTYGQFWSMRWVVAFLIVCILSTALITSPLTDLNISPGNTLVYLFKAAFACFALLVTAAFAVSLGIHISLRSKSALFAIGLTSAITFIVGGGYFFFGCCLFAPLAWSGAAEWIEKIIFIPCVPVYLSVPGWFETDHDEVIQMFVQCCLGIALYGIAAAVLTGLNIHQFDPLAGRTHGKTRPAPGQPILATLVEEASEAESPPSPN